MLIYDIFSGANVHVCTVIGAGGEICYYIHMLEKKNWNFFYKFWNYDFLLIFGLFELSW